MVALFGVSILLQLPRMSVTVADFAAVMLLLLRSLLLLQLRSSLLLQLLLLLTKQIIHFAGYSPLLVLLILRWRLLLLWQLLLLLSRAMVVNSVGNWQSNRVRCVLGVGVSSSVFPSRNV